MKQCAELMVLLSSGEESFTTLQAVEKDFLSSISTWISSVNAEIQVRECRQIDFFSGFSAKGGCRGSGLTLSAKKNGNDWIYSLVLPGGLKKMLAGKPA